MAHKQSNDHPWKKAYAKRIEEIKKKQTLRESKKNQTSQNSLYTGVNDGKRT